MISTLFLQDLRAQTAGTQLGLAWSLFYPLLFFANYILVFNYILESRFEGISPWQYIMMIISGLVPALAFNQAVTMGTGSLIAGAGLLKGTLINPDILPPKAVCTAFPNLAVGFGVVLLIGAATGNLAPHMFWAIPFVVLLLMLCCGLAWFLAALNVFLRDAGQIVSAVLFPLMMMSPVAYPVEKIPAAIKPLMYINPFYYFVPCFQDVLALGRQPHIEIAVPFAVLSIAAYFLGYAFFARSKALWLDHV